MRLERCGFGVLDNTATAATRAPEESDDFHGVPFSGD